MKRSEINKLLREAAAFADKMNFRLPPFAYWSPEEWAEKGHEYDEIRDNMLGWDITDFGKGDFDKIGLLLFTIRNGNLTDKKYGKPYAEKLLIVEVDQVTPYHFHWQKMEDIINRGGGELVIKLYNSDEKEDFADTPVLVSSDGRNYEIPAGGIVRLTPGESITLKQGQYHKFWAEKGKTLVGEVSKVNDDRVDNRFYEETGRFPEIEEDEKPLYLLGNEYPAAKD
ncbi:MAG: D-lyxose/D-mannose family sugar isomerase [Abditibacteriota bacterium]|nr:D-lyxose/D-mannose family sugar isomerase [Abditibacteriota bacterium]